MKILLCVACLVVAVSAYEDTLKQVHVIFRHGDRTPDLAIGFPNNPYVNETYFPYGHGELNLKGKTRAYNLGTRLRVTYGKFLGKLYYNNLLKAYSSDYGRTQMTLLAVLAAMFPPEKDYQIDKNLNWQPITYTVPKPDKYIAVHIDCPSIYKFDITTNVDNATKELYEYLTIHSGMKVNSSFECLAIQNTLFVQAENGLKLPSWTDPIWPDKLEKAALQFWVELTKHSLPKVVGHLLYKIVEDSKKKISGESNEKIIYYSGHDLNVLSILAAVDVYNGEYINYASYVAFELHQVRGVYGFKVYKYNSDGLLPKSIKIKECGYFCPLDVFSKNIVNRYYLGDNWCSK